MTDDIMGKVAFHLSLKVTAAEIATWTPERITAFFDGLAKVRAACERTTVSEPPVKTEEASS